jgi:hypothetical protein
MKVYEWIAHALHADGIGEEPIMGWFLQNRFYPYDLIVRNENDPMCCASNVLQLDRELPKKLLQLVTGKYGDCIEADELKPFLEEEI